MKIDLGPPRRYNRDPSAVVIEFRCFGKVDVIRLNPREYHRLHHFFYFMIRERNLYVSWAQ
jgi:hypothetical protein